MHDLYPLGRRPCQLSRALDSRTPQRHLRISTKEVKPTRFTPHTANNQMGQVPRPPRQRLLPALTHPNAWYAVTGFSKTICLLLGTCPWCSRCASCGACASAGFETGRTRQLGLSASAAAAGCQRRTSAGQRERERNGDLRGMSLVL